MAQTPEKLEEMLMEYHVHFTQLDVQLNKLQRTGIDMASKDAMKLKEKKWLAWGDLLLLSKLGKLPMFFTPLPPPCTYADPNN